MIWLDNAKVLKKKVSFTFLLFVFSVVGCDTADDFGVQHQLLSDVNVKMAEYILPSKNVYLNYLRSDGENNILVGSHEDARTGKIKAEGYFQFSYQSGPMPSESEYFESDTIEYSPDTVIVKNLVTPEDTLQLDSIVLILKSTATIPTNESFVQDFSIFNLLDTLNTDLIYLSGLQQPIENTIVGSYSKTLDPLVDSVHRIRWKDEYAIDFFNYLSEIAKDSARFISSENFQSLALVSNDGSEGILQFDLLDDTSSLVVYTSPISSNDTTYETVFEINQGQEYSYLDRSESNYISDEITEFTFEDSSTLVDPFSGISTYLLIDELKDFFKENNQILINSAFLTFELEGEEARDTLSSFYAFLANNAIYTESGLNVNPFLNVLMSNSAYLGSSFEAEISSLNSTSTKIEMEPTLFFQRLYNNFYNLELQEELGISEPILFIDDFLVENNYSELDGFILVSSVDITTRRTWIKPNGIRLQIYYTEVNQ